MNQIEKNTVKAENQLKKNEFVSFFHEDGIGKRVMFVGNSITRHGILREIGWHNDWGMAASSLENDYVHLVAKKVLEQDENAAFCVCQASEWEKNYTDGEKLFEAFQSAREFKADIIVMRLVENCPRDPYDAAVFLREYEKLLSYLDGKGNAEFVITTSFWAHTADDAIRSYALKKGYPLVELNDLGEDDSMKALGLFEHDGVANHPGDKGMQVIADRIYREVKELM